MAHHDRVVKINCSTLSIMNLAAVHQLTFSDSIRPSCSLPLICLDAIGVVQHHRVQQQALQLASRHGTGPYLGCRREPGTVLLPVLLLVHPLLALPLPHVAS